MAGTKETGWAPPERRRWSEADGRRMVVAFRAAGESVAVFARRHGLVEMRVRRWLEKAGAGVAVAPTAPVVFAPVRVVTAAPRGGGVELGLEGVTIRVTAGFDAELLREVVGALRLPC